MTSQHEDPRLTAYALGELPAEEHAEVEALLARDARAKAEVAALRDVSARLEHGLRAAGGPALSEEQRARLFAALPNGAAKAALAPNGAMKTFAEPPDTATATRAPDPDGAPQPLRAPALVPLRRRRKWLLLAAVLPSIVAIMFMLEGTKHSSESPVAIALSPISTSELVATPPGEMAPTPVGPGRWVTPLDGRESHAVAPTPATGAKDSLAFAEQANAASRPTSSAERARGAKFDSGVRRAPSRISARQESRVQSAAKGFVADRPVPLWSDAAPTSREGYDAGDDNPFIRVATDPRSTFSIDVDTASYANVRRFLQSGQLPPKGAVRIEELVNYFSYAYPEPADGSPFAVVADVARAPWAEKHRLVRIGLKARHVPQQARSAANLVFLVDVSGSMATPDKLPLVKHGLRRLAEQLGAQDRVSLVVYAGASGLVLEAARGDRRGEILGALDRLEAGGSTNGGEGIQLAYELARRHFVKGGINRVILATDGDFNVGVTSQSDLVDLIQRRAKSGVFLSVLGFGTGNYQDSTLEKLADKGNGNYAYIDDASEAQRVLVEQASGTLMTVAKDVKLQLEFNPAEVEAFRLIGYENRVLAHQDFNDDSKDAGEIGADHDVTALYEVIPKGGTVPGGTVDALRYQPPATSGPDTSRAAHAGELLHVKLRYQPPEGGASKLSELSVKSEAQALAGDFRFAAAVAQFGMLLRESPFRGSASYDAVLELARSALGSGKEREAREEFVTLVRKARDLARSENTTRVADPLDDQVP